MLPAIIPRAPASLWVRPDDWLPMPLSVSNKIDILVAIFNNDSNYVALAVTVTGGYTVDWGDGTSENVASTVQADHQYSYADADLGPLTAGGYKQAIISITTQSANDITAFDLGKKNARSGLAAYAQLTLEVQVNAPAATSMTYRGGVEARLVERINIIAIGNITTLANTFSSCSNLQAVEFPVGSLANVNTLVNAFLTCASLQSIEFPVGSLSLVTTMANAFQNCYNLHSIKFPAGSLEIVDSLASTFLSCYSLQSITFPAGSLASVTTLASTFQNCYCLHSITFPAGSLPVVTTLASMCTTCHSLQSVEFPTSSLGSVTDTTSTFTTCGSLSRIINCLIPITFSLVNCKFAGAQLDEVYTALPTVSAKTITVTGNHGTVDDTPTIATAKGWTVT